MAKTAVLEFEEYPGEEVRVVLSPVPTRDFFAILEALGDLRGPDTFGVLFTLFAPFLESWTFPEPADVDGLMARDYNLALGIVRAWAEGVRDAPLPLPLKSSATTLSE